MQQPTNQYPETEAIHLLREGGHWVARSERFRSTFDTDTLPTPYRDTAGAAWVLSTICELNPGVTVTVEGGQHTDGDCEPCRDADWPSEPCSADGTHRIGHRCPTHGLVTVGGAA